MAASDSSCTVDDGDDDGDGWRCYEGGSEDSLDGCGELSHGGSWKSTERSWFGHVT